MLNLKSTIEQFDKNSNAERFKRANITAEEFKKNQENPDQPLFEHEVIKKIGDQEEKI